MPKKREKAKTNRKYKDSVFTLLFSKKENLLELYNAIENTNYGSETEIKITTLRNVLFKGQQNDISFVLGGKLVILIEHQSTINNNMPLRLLIYMAKVYERIVERNTLYIKGMVSIPKPEFIVLYNGVEDTPEQQELRLSDMFKDLGDDEAPKLELVARVYNISKGHNEELAKRSVLLEGYGIFVYLVREYMKSMSRDSAIAKAMEDCIRRNVLKDFLEEHSSEVYNMLKDLTYDEALAVSHNEGIAIGETRGRQEGIAVGMEKVFSLLENGMSLADAKKKLGMQT